MFQLVAKFKQAVFNRVLLGCFAVMALAVPGFAQTTPAVDDLVDVAAIAATLFGVIAAGFVILLNYKVVIHGGAKLVSMLFRMFGARKGI